MHYLRYRSVSSGLLAVLCAAFFAASPVCADPKIETFPGRQPAHPGAPFEIICEVSWGGAPDAYVILPAEVDPADWGEVSTGPAQGLTRDGKNVVRQSVFITPSETGDFEAPDIRIGYLRPEDLTPPEPADAEKENGNAPEEFPRLRADGIQIAVRHNLTWLWVVLAVAGSMGALVVAFIVVLIVKAVRRGGPATPASGEPGIDIAQALRTGHLAMHEAKKRRLDGDYYGFYQELARAAEGLGPEARDLAKRLKKRADEVGFKGEQPLEDEMDSDYRAVSRCMKQIGEGDGGEAVEASQEDEDS